MTLVPVLLPLAMAVVVFLTPSKLWRPRLLAATAAAHFAATVAIVAGEAPAGAGAWLRLDAPGRLLLGVVSLLFLACAVYSVGYLRYRVERENRRFCACMLAALGSMSLVAYAQHLGLLWVGIEATTLATAPLIYFNRTARSIEATWKYLVISSVGIALALLGSFFVGYAALLGGGEASMLFGDLLASAPSLSKPWLRAGFTLLLVGYGAKLGLAPMHTWKPDAYGEAPGVVGAILAGGLTSCAFFALLRLTQITAAAGEGVYARRLLVVMGLVSMAVAGALMLGQRDLKRMLAYSSVEQMGLLAMASGLGPTATFATLFHLVNNAFGKGVMFFAVGNLHRAFGGKTTVEVHGGLRRLPLSGTLFFLGLFAVTGSPPFGPFVSELLILQSAFGAGRWVVGGLFLAFLLLAFAGMGATTLAALQGRPPRSARRSVYRERFTTCAPAIVLLGLVLLFGLHLPVPIRTLIEDAAAALAVGP
ncbi:MAG TPA: proton-conducting transporter membrane subunit [Thermoanaerobaculia bacterium]|nr:proton-conducting transporter membrane subunit [Thermoanaerobaculia bacterium]